MENVKAILDQTTAHSLVLLDELGAGTDPKEGAALAMAILDKIGALGSDVVVTTHYPELKAFAYDRPETINASMEFDQKRCGRHIACCWGFLDSQMGSPLPNGWELVKT